MPYNPKPFSYWRVLWRLNNAKDDLFRIAPLVDRVKEGEELSPEDVRPYRKSIKRLSPAYVRFLNRVAVASSVVGVGVPLRVGLNKKIESEFVKRLPELVESGLEFARTHIEDVEPHVAFLEQFENPRRQVQDEFRVVINGIKQYAKTLSLGEVSSRSAAEAIRSEIDEIFSSTGMTADKLPILSHVLLDRIEEKPKMPEQEILEIAAPDIMAVLNSALPDNERDLVFVEKLEETPHPKRKLATLFSTKLDSFRRNGTIAVSGLVRAIPASGVLLREMYENIKAYIA